MCILERQTRFASRLQWIQQCRKNLISSTRMQRQKHPEAVPLARGRGRGEDETRRAAAALARSRRARSTGRHAGGPLRRWPRAPPRGGLDHRRQAFRGRAGHRGPPRHAGGGAEVQRSAAPAMASARALLARPPPSSRGGRATGPASDPRGGGEKRGRAGHGREEEERGGRARLPPPRTPRPAVTSRRATAWPAAASGVDPRAPPPFRSALAHSRRLRAGGREVSSAGWREAG